MKPIAFGALLAFWTLPALSDVAPFLEHQKIGVVIAQVSYPETLPKDLKSGLTNRILIRVTLLSSSNIVAQRTVDVSVKYDLWDEKFLVTMVIDATVTATNTYSNATEVIARLASLRIADLFAVAELASARELTLRAELLVNPIERERMDKIRKWVVDNSTYMPMNSSGNNGGPAAASRSNELFNKIFEQYASGADLAAAWKYAESSKPFKLQDLADAK
jgi:hypothetical protein